MCYPISQPPSLATHTHVVLLSPAPHISGWPEWNMPDRRNTSPARSPPPLSLRTIRVSGRCGVCLFLSSSPTCDAPHATDHYSKQHQTPLRLQWFCTRLVSTDSPPPRPRAHTSPILTIPVQERCGVRPSLSHLPTCDTQHATQLLSIQGNPNPMCAMLPHTASVSPPPHFHCLSVMGRGVVCPSLLCDTPHANQPVHPPQNTYSCSS
jgi:hypothetical protein